MPTTAPESGAASGSPDRLCLFCRHWRMESATPGYSEYTPGGPGLTYCVKSKWAPRDPASLEDKEFRALMRYAENCDAYEPATD